MKTFSINTLKKYAKYLVSFKFWVIILLLLNLIYSASSNTLIGEPYKDEKLPTGLYKFLYQINSDLSDTAKPDDTICPDNDNNFEEVKNDIADLKENIDKIDLNITSCDNGTGEILDQLNLIDNKIDSIDDAIRFR